MIRKVVLEGCLGDWSKKSYVRNLAEKAGTGKIEFYAVDTRDIEDENGTLYVTPVKFVNKKRDWNTYDSIDTVDCVFIAAPHELHCKIAAHWLENRKLNKNGKIFIEKPLDSSVENIKELEKCEESEKRIIAIDHYIPKIVPLQNELEKRKGKYGKIKKVKFNILESDPILESRKKTLDEGLILDIFPHILAVFTKVMNAYNTFELDAHTVDILEVETGRYEDAPIRGETFAKIIIRADNISLESYLGKAVDTHDNKVMEIVFERAFLTADFVQGNFFITTEDDSVDGNLQKSHISMLLDCIIDEGLDEDNISKLFLSFKEGVEIVKIVSKIRDRAGESTEYEKNSSLNDILMKIKEFKGNRKITKASRRDTDNNWRI